MVDLAAELAGPNIRRMRKPVSGSMYLLGIARELTTRIEPLVTDGRNRHVLSLCRKVLVRMAYADSVSVDPDGTAPREIPAAAGAARAGILAGLARLERDGLELAVELADHEGALLDAAELSVQADFDRLAALDGTSDELQVDPRAVLSYLAGRPGESDCLAVARLDFAPGGYSKQTLLVELEGSRTLPDSLVIRKDHPAAVMQTSVRQEFPVLARLHAAGLRTPRPLFLETSSDFLGAPFMGVTRSPGRIEGAHLVAPRERALASQLAIELGRLHSIDTSEFAGVLPAAQRSDPEALRAEIDLLRRYWDEFARSPSITLAVAFAWLEKHTDRVVPAVSVLHGDIGFHNVLVENGRITAVLDWELARLGHPAEDIGYCRSTVQRMVPWHSFVQAYETAGGPHIDPLTQDFYTLLQLCRFVVYEVRGRGLFEFAKTEDFGMAYIGAHELPALVHRLSEMLRDVLTRYRVRP